MTEDKEHKEMAIDIESKEYQDGREKLYEHVQRHHSEPLDYIVTVKDAQKGFVRSIREGYEESLDKAHKDGVGDYASADYTEGAKEGVRDWEKQVVEGERIRHAERERSFLERAW